MGVCREARASADFFPGEGKIFQVWQKYTISLKMAKNILFSFKKVEEHTILAKGGGQVPPLALPCECPCREGKSRGGSWPLPLLTRQPPGPP